MGQYYKAAMKTPKEKVWNALKAWDFNNGAKLTEHAIILNNFVAAAEKMLQHNPMQLVWAGDYAKDEPKRGGNIYAISNTCSEEITKKLYNELNSGEKIKNFECGNPIIYNHTKNQYIDLRKYYEQDNDKNWIMHPLPLLTCDGNGAGNGDYFGEKEKEYVGIWARDVIEILDYKTFREKYVINNPEEIMPMFDY